MKKKSSNQFVTRQVLKKELNDLFKRLDKKFDAIDSKFAAIDMKFDAIDKKFAAIDKQFEGILKKLEEHDKRFESIEAKLKEHDEKFDNLIKAQNYNLDLIDEKFNELERKISSVEGRVLIKLKNYVTKKDLEAIFDEKLKLLYNNIDRFLQAAAENKLDTDTSYLRFNRLENRIEALEKHTGFTKSL